MEIGHSEDLAIDGTIILRWIFETWDRGMDWILFPQDWN